MDGLDKRGENCGTMSGMSGIGDWMAEGAAYRNPRPVQGPNLGPMAGLQALCSACTKIYPDQPNPLQVTARIKYWLGGPDPLDYISMYWNSGDAQNVPPHWHYVSFGLSDLHGDGRVHPERANSPNSDVSGFGIELSFRLIGEPGRPPLWPAALLQRLATYIFKTGNRFCVGDHIAWHSALDGSDDNIAGLPTDKITKKRSKIRHMIVAEDPQLQTVDTPLGKVQFVQVVGVTNKEMKVAKRAGGAPILEEFAKDNKWFVTNLERQNSVQLPEFSHSPSELSGVAATCRWEYWKPDIPEQPFETKVDPSELSQDIKDEIKCVLQKGLTEIGSQSANTESANIIKPQTFDFKIKNDSLPGTDCKMSTDSVKFELIDDCFKCSAPLKNNFSLSNSIQKDLIMSTDSFEMNKIGLALMEDLKHLNSSKSKEVDAETTCKKLEETNNSNEQNLNNLNKPNIISKEILKADHQTTSTIEISQKSHNKDEIGELWMQSIVQLPGVHLIFDQEAGSVLPLALRCRILHGRHFTWEAVGDGQGITLVASNVSGAMVSSDRPITAYNGWLQILIDDGFAREMAKDVEVLLENDNADSDEDGVSNNLTVLSPLVFAWPHRGLKITVLRNL